MGHSSRQGLAWVAVLLTCVAPCGARERESGGRFSNPAAAVAARPISLLGARLRGLAPWVIAHRGASAEAPENTLAAFRQAVLDGSDVVELDCQSTSDGHLVVLHDFAVDRTSNGKGAVSRTTLKELRKLDAGSWKGPRFAGEPVPTLEEVARFARESGVGLMVEAKTPYVLDPGLVERIADVLERGGVLDRSLIESFDHRPLGRLHARRPDVMLGPLVDAGIDAVEALLESAGTWSYLPAYVHMLPDRVAEVHRLGYRVCVWTVDDPEHMRMMVAAGVDGIMTNRPRTLRRLMERLHLKRRPWPR